MLIGVISDTHGNLKAIQEVSQRLRAAGVELVIHLGDDYRDADWLSADGFRVLAVPGLYCPEFKEPGIPNLRLEELAGVRVLLTHSPEFRLTDLPPQQLAAGPPQLVLFGHTHIPALSQREGVIWLNPGHLKDQDKRGHPQTYALLQLEPSQVVVQIRKLADGTVLENASFFLTPRAGD